MIGDAGRRHFLKMAGLGGISLPLLGTRAEGLRLPAEPAFPALSLKVSDFGAKADGVTKDTLALQQAIDRCSALGGGEVVLPPGRYCTGTLYLRSRTRLRFMRDAEIFGSKDLSDYPIHQVRWEGNWIPGHGGLLLAIDAENVAVAGPGKIHGAAEVGGRPAPDHPYRHPALIEFINCRNILLDGFATDNDRMWNVHPTACDGFVARNLTIRSTTTFSDGIDIDSCRDVLIENCDISVGDDCIAIKSGRGMEGYTIGRPSENVVVRGCTFADSRHACVSVGSEVSAGARNIRISDCNFTHAKSYAIFLKSRIGRGSFIEDFEVHDLTVANCEQGFMQINLIDVGLQDPVPVPGEAGIPRAAHIGVRRVKLQNVPQVLDAVRIDPRKPLDGLTIEDISGDCQRGLYIANARNVNLSRISLSGVSGPWLNTYNVTGKGLAEAAIIDGPALPDLAPSVTYQLK